MKKLKRFLKLTVEWIHDKIVVLVFKLCKPYKAVEVMPNVYYVMKGSRAYDPINHVWWNDDENQEDYCKLHKDTAIEIADELTKQDVDSLRRL